MTDKINIIHFHNGTGGGVFSVIKNLVEYSQNADIENHVIYTINKVKAPEFDMPGIKGVASQQVFYYSPKWNFYYTCKQLAKLIPDEKAIIVAHDWLELGMVSHLGLQNPVVQFLHGDFDFYYDLAKKHRPAIDAYICVSRKIFFTLRDKLPIRTNSIIHLKFPVPHIEPKSKFNNSLGLIYFVRDLSESRKQFCTVIEIAQHLSNLSKDFFFTIAGGGMDEKHFFEIWPPLMRERVQYLGHKKNEEIIKILKEHDIFLLPSTEEGLPVSLVESMKAGLVPLISYWDKSVDELVSSGKTGYFFNINASIDYSECIKKLESNRQLLQQLSRNCMERANALFDPEKNTKAIENVFLGIAKTGNPKKPVKVYGSRLDKRWIPNRLVKTIRYFGF